MTRFHARSALLFAAALGTSAAVRAQTEPVAPVVQPAEMPPAEAPPTEVAPAEPAEAPVPAAVPPPPASPSPPAPLASQATTEPAGDAYGGPPLLFGGGKKKVKVGAFLALGGGYTRFHGRDSGLGSLEAALLLDHRFSLGLVGYGFSRTPRGPDASDGTRQEFGAAYGGLAIRYSWLSNLPVYPTFGVVIGGGAVNLHRESDWDDDWGHDWHDHDDDDWSSGRFDPFVVVQPEVAVHANATRWLRLGVNVGYRFTGGVGRFGLDEKDLDGVVAGGTIAFGWF
jgi:hypothetical protein